MYNGTELTNKGTQVFNAIWGNVGLRGKLFENDINQNNSQDKADSKVEFITIISNIKNDFYNFINVK